MVAAFRSLLVLERRHMTGGPIELSCRTLSCRVRLSSGHPLRPVTHVSKSADQYNAYT
jgi:hypothetical protein